jgi:hypothetical protein
MTIRKTLQPNFASLEPPLDWYGDVSGKHVAETNHGHYEIDPHLNRLTYTTWAGKRTRWEGQTTGHQKQMAEMHHSLHSTRMTR